MNARLDHPSMEGSMRVSRARWSTVRLRPYQVAIHDEVAALLASGHRDVGLVSPTGAGKTMIAKCLAAGWLASGPERSVIILAPTNAVVRAFREPGPLLHNGHTALPWRQGHDPKELLPQASAVQLTDLRWLASASGAIVATRQAWGNALALDRLGAAPAADALCGVLVIADEAHHHHPGSKAGQLLALLKDHQRPEPEPTESSSPGRVHDGHEDPDPS